MRDLDVVRYVEVHPCVCACGLFHMHCGCHDMTIWSGESRPSWRRLLTSFTEGFIWSVNHPFLDVLGNSQSNLTNVQCGINTLSSALGKQDPWWGKHANKHMNPAQVTTKHLRVFVSAVCDCVKWVSWLSMFNYCCFLTQDCIGHTCSRQVVAVRQGLKCGLFKKLSVPLAGGHVPRYSCHPRNAMLWGKLSKDGNGRV